MDPNEAEAVDSEIEAALERSGLNRQRPINTLPPEVLHVVFLPAPGSLRSFYNTLLGFRRDQLPVSSRISGDDPSKLQKSNLDVEYEDGNEWNTDPEKEEKLTAFASMVEPLTPRWKALEYYRGSCALNDRILSLPLPNLTRIQIVGPAYRIRQPILDAAPKLSYVNVRMCSLNWTVQSFSGLRGLSLYNTDISLNRLMIILRASPSLRSLSLEKLQLPVGRNGFPDSSTNKTILPQLRTLHIEGASMESIPFLLDQIEVPSLKTVRVEIGYLSETLDYPQLCGSAGRHIGAFLLPEDRDRSHLLIGVWDGWMSLGVGQQRTLICESTWSRTIEPQAKLACITSAMKRMDDRAREEIKVLDLDCTNTEDIGEYLRIVHSHFSRIDQILVRDKKKDRADVDTVLQRLSSPSHLGLWEEWLLPNLTKLQLDLHRSTSANLGDRIVELLKNRKATEGIEGITELKIVVAKGAIDPSTVELLRQSLVLFHLNED